MAGTGDILQKLGINSVSTSDSAAVVDSDIQDEPTPDLTLSHQPQMAYDHELDYTQTIEEILANTNQHAPDLPE